MFCCFFFLRLAISDVAQSGQFGGERESTLPKVAKRDADVVGDQDRELLKTVCPLSSGNGKLSQDASTRLAVKKNFLISS